MTRLPQFEGPYKIVPGDTFNFTLSFELEMPSGRKARQSSAMVIWHATESVTFTDQRQTALFLAARSKQLTGDVMHFLMLVTELYR